jgi:hypothetical protein
VQVRLRPSFQKDVVVGQFVGVLLPSGHVRADPPVAHHGGVARVDSRLVVQENLGGWMLEERPAEHCQFLTWYNGYVKHILSLCLFLGASKSKENKPLKSFQYLRKFWKSMFKGCAKL